MKIIRHRQFKKNFKARLLNNPKLVKEFKERLKLLLIDPDNPLLRDHKLIGERKEYRAFSVTGDIRVVYKKSGDNILLYDIGTHNQVY